LDAATPNTFELDVAVLLAEDEAAVAALGVASALADWVVVPFTCALAVLLVDPRSVLRVWLMLTSCSRLLTDTSWLTYSFGSAFEVGSWFFNSVTSRVRKSLDEMVAAELLELLVLLVVLARGLALAPVNAWLVAVELLMIPANADIFPPYAAVACLPVQARNSGHH